MTQEHFVREDGKQIPFLNGYLGSVERVFPLGLSSSEEFAEHIRESKQESRYPKTDSFLVNKVVTSFFIMEYLSRIGVRDRARRTLDICSGPAVLPRLLKLFGWAAEAHAIDLLDRSGDFSEDKIMEIVQATQSEVTSGPDGPYNIQTRLEYLWRVQLGLSAAPMGVFLREQTSDISLDNCIVGDFLTADIPGQYDLITLTAGMEYFDTESFFEKVGRLLAPGGIFMTFNDYFYNARGASMCIVAEAPWMHCMLSKADFRRYLDERLPDKADAIMTGYYFGSTHHGLEDFRAAAERSGLTLRQFSRGSLLIPSEQTFKAYMSFALQTALPLSRDLNPGLMLDDLFTYYLAMGFQKT